MSLLRVARLAGITQRASIWLCEDALKCHPQIGRGGDQAGVGVALILGSF
jgi:hypothetical protein